MRLWTDSAAGTRAYAVRARLRTSLAVLVLVGVGTGASACGDSSEPRDTDDGTLADHPSDLPSDLPRDAALLLQPDPDTADVAQLGSAPVTVSWARISDGQATPIDGPPGTQGLDMPDFTTDRDYPRAALVVRNAGSDDPLSPGTADFMWGADFQLDADSTAPSGPDNGDNLLQRGLWGQEAEFKAEADLRRASCAVHGTEGTLIVRAKMAAEPGTWYRMRCLKEADGLTVTVRELGDAGWGEETSAHVSGPVGEVTYQPTIPISVGGKVTPDGELIRSATDQFNGWIASPVVRIESSS